MEKSKAESYMKRLQQWREEKDKNKENKTCQKTSKKPLPIPVVSRPVLKGTNTCSVKKTVKTADISEAAKKSVHTTLKPHTGNISSVKSAVSKKRNSEDSKLMLAKLSKWKEEKSKSERKKFPVSTTKSKPSDPPHRSADPSQPSKVQVKSRLFDYLNKPKPSAVPTSSKTEHAGEQNYINLQHKPKPTTQVKHTVPNKPTLKRRHSEVSKAIGQRKPGILKRKSCIGLFDLAGETNLKPSPKRRRLSSSVSKSSIAERETILEKEESVDTLTRNVDTCKQLPETPGTSSRNVRFITPPNSHIQAKTLRKTPKTPATRKADLDSWIKAKGRTPSKFRHLMCFHGHGEKHAEEIKDPSTKTTLSIDELSEQMNVLEQERLLAEAVEQMNSMLDECIILFEAGCPVESIVPWLDDIYKQIPVARTSARYYTCKASVIKSTLDLDAVLEVFEQATINNAQPKEEIAKCLTETLKFVTEEKVRQAKKRSRTPRRSYIQEENIFESSSVVYTVANVTPFSEGKRSSSKKSRTPGQCQVVTPVRRSTRRSLQNLPESLKDSKRSYSNLHDVENKDNMLFQPNKALENMFNALDDE